MTNNNRNPFRGEGSGIGTKKTTGTHQGKKQAVYPSKTFYKRKMWLKQHQIK